jgi:UDP-N-acetylmuramoyl-L-alanyl-D-glutamate--2,6-diaminopimelate ligase
MKLADLASQIPVSFLAPATLPDLEIAGVTHDSRSVRPGYLFVAVPGLSTDGHQFIPHAIENGAVAVLGDQHQPAPYGVPYLQVAESRFALAWIAAALQDFPAKKMTVIGITGTDGKTTTATMLFHILKAAGIKAGLITTVSAVIGDQELDTGFHVTTPEAVDVQRYLAQMQAAGTTHVVLETTSHGLAQHRATACEFDIAIVTNITHEHLDYHGGYDQYRAAKAMLFTSLADTHKPDPVCEPLAVLNGDDSSYTFLNEITSSRKINYSNLDPRADFYADDIQHTPQGLSFTIKNEQTKQDITSPLIGHYNVHNILAAYSAAVEGLGIAPEIAALGIQSMQNVPGRMETIDMGQNFLAIVDFAHTPNALKMALQTLRTITKGKIWAVFGSAGLRDRQKRAMMGEVSAQYADYSVITAEDPRTESLTGILAEMAYAAASRGAIEGETFWRIPDRGAAIQFAVDHAAPGDIVCAFGKGHEQSMCFGTYEHPWDDRTAMRAALASHLGKDGPAMPYLPTQELDYLS